MENFCGSEFWNTTQIWDTNDPEFTECFEKTVLAWTPCIFLWVFSGLEVYYVVKSNDRDIPWTWKNISKLLITTVLCGISVSDLVANVVHSYPSVYSVNVCTPLVELASFLIILIFTLYNRKYGIRTSGIQFIFWLLFALCGCFQFKSSIRKLQNDSTFAYPSISYLIFYTLVVVMLIINFFADARPKITMFPITQKTCPEVESSFISQVFFFWMDPFLLKGYRNPLALTDMWDIKPEYSSDHLVPIFHRKWIRAEERRKKKVEKRREPNRIKMEEIQENNHVNEYGSGPSSTAQDVPLKDISVLPILFQIFGPALTFAGVLLIIDSLIKFAYPKLIELLVDFVKTEKEQWKGYFYASSFLLLSLIQTAIFQFHWYISNIISIKIRTCLSAAIYRKALRLSVTSRKDKTIGEIVNLMAVDIQTFMDIPGNGNFLWLAPLEISLSLYFLYNTLGPSVFAGLGVMILMIPFNAYTIKKLEDLQMKQMKTKDIRVKLINEILNGIKVLKLYAWELSFEEKIQKIRGKEIKLLKYSAVMNALNICLYTCAPFLVAVVSFATYVLVDEKHVLNAEITFVSLALFNILRDPLTYFPSLITEIVEAFVSMNRINEFLNHPELDPENVHHNKNEEIPLTVKNATFSWGDQPVLKNINLQFHKGSLTAIVGTVGSGKSSLISSMLGEMEKISGEVNCYGSTAYVAQHAWIQNATLKDNILFGKEFNENKYKNIIEACALKHDLEILPGGDQTEIGEKGINLSGGQKQRVSLARAVYADCDIYLLDDPLSAVDSHVGRHLFDKVLGPSGILDGKTRILVTHGITFLPHTDHIAVMKDGQVSEYGTYNQLLERKSAFAEYLMHHLQEGPDVEEDELQELSSQLSSSEIAIEIDNKIRRQRSRVSETHSEVDSHHSGSVFKRQKSSDSMLISQISVESVEKVKRQISATNDIKMISLNDKLIDDERMEVGGVKWAVYKFYIKMFGCKMAIGTVVSMTLYQLSMTACNFWLTLWSTDPDLNKGQIDPGKRNMYLGVYAGLGIAQGFLSIFCGLLPELGCCAASEKLHSKLMYRVLRAPMSFFDTTPIGRIIARFSKDVSIVDTSLANQVPGAAHCTFEIIATMILFIYTMPVFVSCVIPIIVIYYLIQRFSIATARQVKRLRSVTTSPIYSHFHETISGVTTVRAFSKETSFVKHSDDLLDTNQVCNYTNYVVSRWLSNRLEIVGDLFIFCVVLIGVLTIKSGEFGSGLIGLIITYALEVTNTSKWAVRLMSDIESNIVAVERIKEYGEIEQEAPWEIPTKFIPKFWPETGKVQFANYSVRYRPTLDLVLKKVSFDVNDGEKIGIIGRTGAGKSSLTLCLFRILEAAGGEIVIDGMNIAELGLHSLRSKLSIIPQDAVLFSGSLRMNLDPFEKHPDEEIWKSLELAHLKDFVTGLAAGIQHEIAEGGENLSAGQRQLICLSRALLRKTKILILDEATAAVDLETDEFIQKTIRQEFKQCTVLTIAHRLNTIMDSDRVLVLDNGEIAEFDVPGNLLQNENSIFYSMCKEAGLV